MAKPLVVDLSADFDFFVRELPEWDFGHGTTGLFAFDLWPLRYASLDLHKETDIKRFADFPPELLPFELMEKGFDSRSFSAPRFMGCAASHVEAFSFFLDSAAGTPPDVVLNIDAHHDCWPYEPLRLHCGNWMTALHEKWSLCGTGFAQVYPRWKKPSLDGPPHVPCKVFKWSSFSAEKLRLYSGVPSDTPIQIRNVFVCLSPEWVAPHHDADYKTFVKSCMFGFDIAPANFRELGLHPNRAKLTPTADEARAAREMLATQMRKAGLADPSFVASLAPSAQSLKST